MFVPIRSPCLDWDQWGLSAAAWDYTHRCWPLPLSHCHRAFVAYPSCGFLPFLKVSLARHAVYILTLEDTYLLNLLFATNSDSLFVQMYIRVVNECCCFFLGACACWDRVVTTTLTFLDVYVLDSCIGGKPSMDACQGDGDSVSCTCARSTAFVNWQCVWRNKGISYTARVINVFALVCFHIFQNLIETVTTTNPQNGQRQPRTIGNFAYHCKSTAHASVLFFLTSLQQCRTAGCKHGNTANTAIFGVLATYYFVG